MAGAYGLWFRGHSSWATRVAGSRWAFFVAMLTVVVWLVSGPYFHYSEDWQLVINTGTTIVTFLMVFLIQNTQNRESKAVHLKLDELILAGQRANNQLIAVQDLQDHQIDRLIEHYRKLGERYHDVIEDLPKDEHNE